MIVKIKHSDKSTGWKEGFKSPRFKGTKDSLTAYYDRYGARITGLSKEDEEELGKEFKQDLSPASSFWDDFKITLTSKDLLLDTDKPEDRLKYLVLLAHYRTRKSHDKSKPNADYIIVDEQVEALAVMDKASEKVKAYKTFAELTDSEKSEILRLYPNYNRTDNITPQVISARLFEELEKNYPKFNLLVGDINRNMKVLLKDLVTAHILFKNRSAYKYGDEVIGHNDESTIEYLNDPDNHGLKVSLMKQLKEINSKK